MNGGSNRLEINEKMERDERDIETDGATVLRAVER